MTISDRSAVSQARPEPPAGRLIGAEGSTGNVDPDGDVVGSLIERLRAQVGPDLSAEIDPETQARLTAGLLLTAPLRQVKP